MARTKKVDQSNSGEFKHRYYVNKNGETLYDAPIEIKNRADMYNYGITIEDCKYLRFGSSQKILVYFYKTTNRKLAEYQWEYINNLHSSGYYSTRCMVTGQRKPFIKCRDTNKCSVCAYGKTPETKQAAIVSWDSLIDSGWDLAAEGSVEDRAIERESNSEIYARMVAEDVRIWKALSAKELFGDPVKKIAHDLGVSEPRVYQLIKRAKMIIEEYHREDQNE